MSARLVGCTSTAVDIPKNADSSYSDTLNMKRIEDEIRRFTLDSQSEADTSAHMLDATGAKAMSTPSVGMDSGESPDPLAMVPGQQDVSPQGMELVEQEDLDPMLFPYSKLLDLAQQEAERLGGAKSWDASDQFYSLPCDFQIAVVTYYTLRFAKKEEFFGVDGFGIPGDDEGFTQQRFDKARSNFLEITYMESVKTFIPPRYGMSPMDFTNPSVKDIYPTLVERYGTSTSTLFDLKLMYSVFAKRRSELESKCMRLGLSCLQTDDERFVMNPMQFHFNPESDSNPQIYQLYHFLPGWALIAHELGFFRATFTQGYNPIVEDALETVGYPNDAEYTRSKSKLDLDFKREFAMLDPEFNPGLDDVSSYMFDFSKKFYEKVDDIFVFLQRLLSFNPNSEVLSKWIELIKQYKNEGEVDYSTYNFLARYAMQNGLYQHTSGNRPMWKFFYGIKPIGPACCILDSQKFDFQVLDKVDMILGDFAYGGKSDTLAMSKLSYRIKRTAATMLAVEQDLYLTWNSKVDAWISAKMPAPQWFKDARTSLSNLTYAFDNGRLVGVHSSRQREEVNGVSALLPDIVDLNVYLYPEYNRTSHPTWRMDFIWVETKYYSIFQLLAFQNLNYNHRIRLAEVVGPDSRIQVLKYIEYKSESGRCLVRVDAQVSEIMQEVPQNGYGMSKHRNPIGLSTYSNYDSIYGHRKTGYFTDFMQGLAPGVTDVDAMKRKLYDIVNEKLRILEAHSIQHPRYGFPNAVNEVRLTYKVVKQSADKDKFQRESGYMEGDSIKCITVNPIRQCEDACAYYAIKRRKKYIDIIVGHHKFMVYEALPACIEFWQYVRATNQYLGASLINTQQGVQTALQTIIQFNGSQEYDKFKRLNNEFSRRNFDMVNFFPVESIKSNQTFVLIEERSDLKNALQNLNTPFRSANELISVFSDVETALFNKMMATVGFSSCRVKQMIRVYDMALVDDVDLDLAEKFNGIVETMSASLTLAVDKTRVEKFKYAKTFTTSLPKDPFVNVDKANGSMLAAVKQFPGNRSIYNDLYHHLCVGDEYTGDALCSAVFDIRKPDTRITMDELVNQFEAFEKHSNQSTSPGSVEAFLDRRYTLHTNQPFTSSQELNEHIKKYRKEIHTTKSSLAQKLDSLLTILDEYNSLLAEKGRTPTMTDKEFDALKQQIEDEGVAERRMGHIPRRNPQGNDPSVYPCWETLNSTLKTTSYVDLGVVDATLKPFDDVYYAAVQTLDDLMSFKESKSQFALWDLLVAWEKVENAIEAVFIHTTTQRVVETTKSDTSQKDGERSAEVRRRGIEFFTTRQSTGPSTNIMSKKTEIVNDPYTSFTKSEINDLGIGLTKRKDTFEEDRTSMSFLGMYFPILSPIQEDGESELKTAMRRSKGRGWKLEDGQNTWFNNYEMLLMHSLQVLGNVFRYGGYRSIRPSTELLTWRYPDYSSDIDPTVDHPRSNYFRNSYGSIVHEENRFYPGILDDRKPDERSWAERMLGDKFSPPRWNTRSLNGENFVDSRSGDPYNEQTDFYRYMVSDSDSILETFCSIATSWLSLFNPNVFNPNENDDEYDDESSDSPDDVFRRIDEHFKRFELPDSLVVDGRFENLVKFHQHVGELDGVLYGVISSYNPKKRGIDIFETQEEFKKDSFDMYEEGYQNKVVSNSAYKSLFMQPSSKDLEKFKSDWNEAITHSQITLRTHLGYIEAIDAEDEYGTNGRGGPRWGGFYILEANRPAPDLQAALKYLANTQNGSGYELLYMLDDIASEDAVMHIEFLQKRFDVNYGDPSTSTIEDRQELERLQSEIDKRELARKDKNSLYNVVRHAILLKDLDTRLFADESDKRTERLMNEVSTQISNAIFQLAVEKNGTVVGLDFERLVQGKLDDGIRDAINNIVGVRSYRLAKQKTQEFFYRIKAQKMKKKVDEVVQSMNKLITKDKVSFNAATILHMLLSMKWAEQTIVRYEAISMKDVFERGAHKVLFNQLFQTVVHTNYKNAKKRGIVENTLKSYLCLLFDLYSVGGFPLKTADAFNSQKFHGFFKDQFHAMQVNTWNGLYISAQKPKRTTANSNSSRLSDRKVNAQLAAQNVRGSKRSRSDNMNEFENPLSKAVIDVRLRQSMKELARDVRLLAVGFQDPYFPNDTAKENFLTRIGAKKSDYQNTLRDLKIKYPGINGILRINDPSFASLQRFASEFSKLLKEIIDIEGDDDAVNRALYEVSDRMRKAPNFHYEKDDNLAAMMVANDDGLVNADEIALKGQVAFQLWMREGSFKWWYLDLSQLHAKPSTRMHYNKLRILALDTMSALSREFELSTRTDTTPSERNAPLPSYTSLIETLNARRLQFEERACYMIKQVVQQITLQVGSPGLIKSEVKEFMRSSFVESSQLSRYFDEVFSELCIDLQQVVDFESRWDTANEHLHVLRIEDLYKRLSSGGASSNYDTLDAGSLLDTTIYDTSYGVEDVSGEQHVTFTCNNKSTMPIYGIDLRVSTISSEWKTLRKRYELNESQIQIENQERLKFGPMTNKMYPWQKLDPPTIESVRAAMNALQVEAGGRDPFVQSKRPPIRLVDRIEHNFYAHFVDVLCLAHQKPDTYMKMLTYAYELKNQPNANPLLREEESPIYRRGLKLRRIYNPNGVNSTPENQSVDTRSAIDLFYENSRFIKSSLKYSQITVQAVNEIIRNYSLVRQLPFQEEGVDPETGNFSIFETDDSLIEQWERVQYRPMNEKDFNAYVQDFKHRARKGVSALGLKMEDLESPNYRNLKEMFNVLNQGNVGNQYQNYAAVVQNASQLARALAIPLYPRPNEKRFANEQTYSETLSASRRKWLNATALTVEKSNPKNLYDSAFVERLGFDESQLEAEPEGISVVLPKDDFAGFNEVRFKNDVDNIRPQISKTAFPMPKRAAMSERSGLAKGRGLSTGYNNQQTLEQIDAQSALDAYNDWLMVDKSGNASNTVRLRTVDESPRRIAWVSACLTVSDGNCFYHSMLINMGSIFRDNQDLLNKYFDPTSRDKSIRLLKTDIMRILSRAIADCGRYLDGQSVPMADDFQFNPFAPPSIDDQETYSRWKCCNFIYQECYTVHISLFQPDGAYAEDFKRYTDLKNHYRLPNIDQSTDFIGIMKALYEYFNSDFVYVNYMVIEMAAQLLRTPIVSFDTQKPPFKTQRFLLSIVQSQYGTDWRPTAVDSQTILALIGVELNGMTPAQQYERSETKLEDWNVAKIDQMLQNDAFVKFPVRYEQTWQYTVGTVAGSEYAQPNAPCFMLYHPGVHFEAVYPRHLEAFATQASQATFPMFQGNNVQPYVQQATAQALVAAPEAPILINVFDKKMAELSE